MYLLFAGILYNIYIYIIYLQYYTIPDMTGPEINFQLKMLPMNFGQIAFVINTWDVDDVQVAKVKTYKQKLKFS